MAKISLIRPLDQPVGTRRLIDELRSGIVDPGNATFQFVTAFAKVGPLLRLEEQIKVSRKKGLKIEAVFGVDQWGTSAQALQFALSNFDAVYITREPNITFHPKVYMFSGGKSATVVVGSNNLTVGGTETNFEAAIILQLHLPADAAELKKFSDSWADLLPANCKATTELTPTLLNQLVLDGTVPDEATMRSSAAASKKHGAYKKPARSGLKLKPPSPLPKKKVSKSSVSITSTTTSTTLGIAKDFGATGLAIQIKPHHNGEIFLSVTAALQNPAFFKWPFTGMTVPKKGAKNPGYPQLTPDPLVNISVYGKKSDPILELSDYQLNTVYYEKKSEIRITASPLVGVVPDYSIMIIVQSEQPGLDYEIVIYRPDSPDYGAWLAECNQEMPGGGSTPRKFGWF